MNIRAAIFLLLFTIQAGALWGQSSYSVGVLPTVNLNKKLGSNYKINFSLATRHGLESGLFSEENDFDYHYLLTDFTTIVAKKVDYNKTLTLGYLFRVRDDEIIQRSIQQFIIKKNLNGVVLAHRIAADQTFSKNESPEYRLRYRLASQIALNGQSVDPKEFYFKINNEYVNSMQSGHYDLEIRILPFLGYTFSESQKLEAGLDYRINSFISNPASQTFWIGINWYQSF